MPNCKIKGCSFKFSKGCNISFFSVPLNGPNRIKWIQAIEKYQLFDYAQTYYVCSLHFSPEDIKINGKRKTIVPGSVPSIFPKSKNFQSFNSESDGANSLQNGANCETTKEDTGSTHGIATVHQFPDASEEDTQIPDSSNISCGAAFDVAKNSTFEIYTSRESDGENEEDELIFNSDDGNNWKSNETINIEFLYENNLNTNDNELSNSSATLDTYQIPENFELISKTQYKTLLDQSVELARLKDKVSKLEILLKEKSADIKKLHRKNVYYEHVLKTKTLEVENNQHNRNQEKLFEILECLQFGRRSKKYSPNVRLFCFTLHFYSPSAYEYVRSTFNLNLPSIRTLRNWYTAIDGSPGFTEVAFNALSGKANELKMNGKPLIVGLIFDEMNIRKHSQWDVAKKNFLGHINAGNPENYEICSPLAKEALVLVVSGIGIDLKISIGYFLSNGLRSAEKAALLNEAILRLTNIGITVASITSDGAKSNVPAYSKLGARFSEDKPYFENTFKKGSNIYVIMDPPHMLKLARNCLGNKKTLYNAQNDKIEWRFLENLVSLQISNNFNFGNKLSRTHIEWESRKMNVRLAAETLSNSAAASIEYLNSIIKNENFLNSEATVQCFRVINNLFDIMNSKPKHCKDEYKLPISEANVKKIHDYFQFAKEYIKGIQIIENGRKVSILKTNSFTPYFGFYHNMTSFIGIYTDHIKANSTSEFYSFDVSQDKVESFFGCIRRMGGCNDNPTAQQFASAYRKLLLHNEVVSGKGANCLNDITKILEVSSGKKSNIPLSENSAELEMLANFDLENLIDEVICDDNQIMTTDQSLLQQNSTALMACAVEEKVLGIMRLKGSKKCSDCMNVFLENEIITDIFIQFKSETSCIVQPCKSTINLIRCVELLLKRYESHNVTFNSMLAHIVRKIDVTNLYEESIFDENHDHKDGLITLIIKSYLDIKSTNLCKLITRMSQSKQIRHSYLKEIHFQGQ